MVEKVLQFNNQRTIFWGLVATLVFLAGFYVFCVRTTISNVVARQNLENEASALSLEIGNNEFEYISKRNTINIELAYSLGFKEGEDKVYISRNSSTKVAYLSN